MSPLLKHCLRFGLILSLSSISITLIYFMFGAVGHWSMSILSLLLTVGVVVWSGLQYRNEFSEGFISYGTAFKVLFLTAFFSTIITTGYNVLHFNFIDPDFQAQILEKTATDLESQGMTDEQIDNALMMTKKFTTPMMTTLMGLIIGTVMSLIIASLAALGVKKENTSFDSFTRS